MKKPKSKNKTAPWHTFPPNIKEWTDEDHALGWLVHLPRDLLRNHI